MQKWSKLFHDDPSTQKTAASPQQVPEDSKAKGQLLHNIEKAETDDAIFQKKQAEILRELAIERLSHAEHGTAAGNVRHEYAIVKEVLGGDTDLFSDLGDDNPYPESFEDFLKIHSKNGVWGTDLEAIALAEYFNVNLVVTAINKKGEENTFVLYKDKKPDAPIIHLYNRGNTHWSFLKDGASTVGDGNCLYNAFAQALYHMRHEQKDLLEQQHETETLLTPPTKQQYTATILPTPEKTEQHEATIESQKKRFEELVGKIDKPGLVMQSLVEEGTQIEMLPVKEQQQIVKDYKLALQLASEEIEETTSNSYKP